MRPASFLLLLALFVASLVLAAVLGDGDGRLEGWEWTFVVPLVGMLAVGAVELSLGPPGRRR